MLASIQAPAVASDQAPAPTIADDTIIRRDCVDCSEAFVITSGQREWFTAKGLSLPRRCEPCRAVRRKAARKAAD